jgi:hypothetical protein
MSWETRPGNRRDADTSMLHNAAQRMTRFCIQERLDFVLLYKDNLPTISLQPIQFHLNVKIVSNPLQRALTSTSTTDPFFTGAMGYL